MNARFAATALLFLVSLPIAADPRPVSPTDAKLKDAATLIFAGKVEEARVLVREAAGAYRAESDGIGEGVSLLLLGLADVAAENRFVARGEISRGAAKLIAAGDGFAAWMALWMSAELERSTGNFGLAIEQHEITLDFLRDAAGSDTPFGLDGAILIVSAFGQDPSLLEALGSPFMKPFLILMSETMTRDAYGAVLTEAGYLREAEHQLTLASASSRQFMGMLDTSIDGHWGDLHRRLWCFNDARASYLKALSGAGGLPMIPLRDEWVTVNIYARLAEIELLSGRPDETLRWNDKALAAVRKTNRRQTAAVLETRGELMIRAGRHAVAEAALREGLAIAEEQGDVHRQASMSALLGALHMLRGQYDDAAQSLEKAVSSYRKVERPDAEALTWTLLSEVYILLGAEDSARETIERARKLAAESGFRQAQVLVELVESSISGDAGKYFGKWWELPETGSLMLGDDVQRVFRELLGLAPASAAEPATSPSSLFAALGHLVRGRALFQRGQVAAARVEWTTALKTNPGNDLRAAFLAGIGGTYWKEGNDDEALRYFTQAVRIAETPIKDVRSEDVMAGYFGSYRRWYFEIVIEMLLRKGRLADAFDYSERARARAFQQMIGSTRLRPAGADPVLVDEADLLRVSIGRMTRETIFGPVGSAEDLRRARERYQALMARVKVVSPEYASLTRVEPLSVEEVRSELPPQTTLISYFVSSARVHAWILDERKLEHVALPIDGQWLRRAVCWASGLGRYATPAPTRGATSRATGCGEGAAATTEEVYDALIAPLRPRIRNERLLIVPHGDLHYVPFAALRDRVTGRYLIEDYPISFAPSAGSLRFMREKETPVNGGVLVIGDPSEERPLPGAKDEAKEIARAFGTTAVIGAHANKKLLRGLNGACDLIHIGAHGAYEPRTPMFSRIELAKDAADPKSDGNLEVHEILADVDFTGVNLVVLSACRSAAGARSGGDDVVGLTRAVLYAGSPGVISTLWDIGDDASAELMGTFYDALLAGQSASDALRAAQLATLKSEPFRDPYFWAAFILNGTPRGSWKR